jgi:hypothetical protein
MRLEVDTMTKKLEVYSPIKEEVGVIMIFTKMHSELGFERSFIL